MTQPANFSRALREHSPDSVLDQLQLFLEECQALQQLGIRHRPRGRRIIPAQATDFLQDGWADGRGGEPVSIRDVSHLLLARATAIELVQDCSPDPRRKLF
ncbi:hypothetical protein [Microvirga sesbaniae]|uniref:hypothetical protein n=1 Tax=Microvirga sesbaniae TaxID=681392 RepID=UPI0021C6777C|nr:hypothetical protein [Microvirga sp. HBU67692]